MNAKNRLPTVLETVSFSFVHGCFVFVGTSSEPSPKDWEEYMRFVSKNALAGRNRALIVDQGGVPNAGQRKALHDLTKGMELSVAVITESAVVRGVVKILSWVSPGYRAFRPSEDREAAAFLGLFGKEASEVDVEATILRRLLRDRSPRGHSTRPGAPGQPPSGHVS